MHTELLTDGIVDLMRERVIDNSRKELNRGKTVAAFCMGKQDTYEFLHDNPGIEFRPVNYTNNPTVLARQKNMTAINSALEIDLSGQATAESLGQDLLQRHRRPGGLHARRHPVPGRQDHPGDPVHGRGGDRIADRPRS